jgi:hypothetical protein
MIEITINGKLFFAPKTWNEAPLHQALSAYSMICREDHLEGFSEAEIGRAQLMAVTAALFRVDRAFFRQWEKTCITEHGDEDGPQIFLSELQAVTEAATAFMFEKVAINDDELGGMAYRMRYELTRCPFPTIEIIKRLKWYGPTDGLDNLTIYELATAFTHFENYAKTDDIRHAHRLLATIFRPGKIVTPHNRASGFEGDRRLPLLKHESTIEGRVPIIAKIALPVRQLLIFWFASCRAQLIASYPNVFQAGDGENKYGWAGVLMSLAGDLPNLDNVAAQKASTALVYLSWLDDQRKLEELRRAR